MKSKKVSKVTKKICAGKLANGSIMQKVKKAAKKMIVGPVS